MEKDNHLLHENCNSPGIITDNFQDLETGKIDIIDYIQGPNSHNDDRSVNLCLFLNADGNSYQSSKSTSDILRRHPASTSINATLKNVIVPQHSTAATAMDVGLLTTGVSSAHQRVVNQNNAQAHHHQALTATGSLQPNIVVGTGSMRANLYAAAHAQNGLSTRIPAHQTDRPPLNYDHNGARLPESPPETDSGGASAGSPSGSETSPYSPDYQGYLHGSSVIHPPVIAANGNQQGVILSVPDLTAAVLNEYNFHSHHHPTATIHHHGPSSQTSPSNNHSGHIPPPVSRHLNGNVNGEFYVNASTPAPPNVVAHQQISPNGYAPSSGAHYTNLLPQQHYGSEGDLNLNRKRLRSETGQYMSPQIKPEPTSPRTHCSDESLFEDGASHQCIRFVEFQKETWHSLCDASGRELPPLGFHVVADKGFNFSGFDGAFVNQKKNHFQVSVHIEVRDRSPPKFVRISGEAGGLKQILEFQLDFFGVKAEMLSSCVQIKQSQTDRKPVSYEPVKLDLPPNRVTKVTVARLHFSETTMNNQRKNGRPNPDQKYFLLVVALNAVVQGNEKFTIISSSSERVIVRASNPGQFDNGESETHWQKGQTPNSVFHPGFVGIGTDRPHTTLTVAGDVSYTGNLYHPSDRRLKENIRELNTAEALSRMSQIRIVRYCIRPEIAEQFGLTAEECERVGVIAQEVEEILPDAVKENGEYLQVDENRIFYESAAAVKELCRLTGNLEYKIDEVEKISKKLSRLSRLKRFDSLRSTASSCASTCPSSCVSSCSQLSGSPRTVRAAELRSSPSEKYTNRELDPTEKDCMTSSGEKYKHLHRHHRSCHHYCRRRSVNDRGLCSNKVIQTTVTILVVVMAFCLVAMATLYILDWHKRNYGSSFPSNAPVGPQYYQSQGTSKPDAGIGQLVQPSQTKRPHVIPGHLPKVSHDFPDPPWESKDSAVHMPSPIRACAKTDCPVYCCPESFLYSVDSFTESNDAAVDIVFGQTPATVEAVAKHDVNNKALDVAVVTADQQNGSSEHTVEDKKITVVDKDHNDSVQKRSQRSVKTLASDFNVTIRVATLNVTIDSRYCYGIGCDNMKLGRRWYFIPVSRYTPLFALDIDFLVPLNGWSTQLCSYQTEKVCFGQAVLPGHDLPDAAAKALIPQKTEGECDSWKLPVGHYTKSAYKFRVSQSTTACDEQLDAASSTYFEYNLLFYRVCKQ